MHSAMEEAISLHYMLCCLGVPVSQPTNLFGDNYGVIQSTSIPDLELKKKHIAISYYFVREAIAAHVINAIWVPTDQNFSDVALGPVIFSSLVFDLLPTSSRSFLGLRGESSGLQAAPRQVTRM